MAVGISYTSRQSAGFLNSFTPEGTMEFYEVALTFSLRTKSVGVTIQMKPLCLAVLLRCTICFSKFYKMKFGISVQFRLWPFL